MSKLLELAERCERATGPDREMDAAIATALGFAPAGAELRDGSLSWKKPAQTERGFNYWKWYVHRAATYTASLDAAMTLVPEGHNWAVESDSDGVGAWCYDKNAHNTGPQIAATPALALTVAALRARAAQGIEARSDKTPKAA